jgi:type I restriction enzyme M protein
MDIFNNINQLFHNEGVPQDKRFQKLLDIIEGRKENEKIKTALAALNNLESVQQAFMTLCSNYTKYTLDQFYTPITIASFINSLLIQDKTKKLLEPACGTGDLALQFKGEKVLYDIDEQVVKFAILNSSLYNSGNCTVKVENSLEKIEELENRFTYSVLNPPFGNKTVISEKKILEKYELGKGLKKQEIGILFIELGLRSLCENGVMFIILPTGYMNNKKDNISKAREYILKHRIIALIRLPQNTFKRSGTGVNTYLIIVQKTTCKKPYKILTYEMDNIGYDLSKKNTPYKYILDRKTGEYLKDEGGNKILDNDFINLTSIIKSFCATEKIVNIDSFLQEKQYNFVVSNELEGNILEIRRYNPIFKQIQNDLSLINIDTICNINPTTKQTINDVIEYNYIDISEVSTPIYNYKKLFGWELPSRAKYFVKKYDILVSRLDGKISATIILEDSKNIIVSNGFFVLRAKSNVSYSVLLSNILNHQFKIQHNSLTTGSIMASISLEDFKKIKISKHVSNEDKISNLISSLESLKNIF